MALSSSTAALIGSGLSSGAGLIGTIVNAVQAPKLQQQAYESDLRNNLELAKYNNDYNYNLWREQMEYNSPLNQRKRLEEAGLNPNFNSIEGAGNASSAPTSQIPTNLHRSADYAQQRAQLRLASINSFAEQISRFIQNYANISAIPANIPESRLLALGALKANLNLKQDQHLRNFIDNLWNNYMKFGANYSGQYFPSGLSADGSGRESFIVDMRNSPLAQKIGLTNANLKLQSEIRDLDSQLHRFDLDHLKPLEESMLKNRALLIGNQAGLTGKQLDWFVANSVSKIGAMSIGSLLGIAKFIK